MKNYKNKNPLYNQPTQNVVFEPLEAYDSSEERCLYCYDFLKEIEVHFHKACCKRFFGQSYVPWFEYNKEALADLAQQFVNANMAVTGVQAKVSLSWHRKQERNALKKLTIVGLYGDYILKTAIGLLQMLARTGRLHHENGRSLWLEDRTAYFVSPAGWYLVLFDKKGGSHPNGNATHGRHVPTDRTPHRRQVQGQP